MASDKKPSDDDIALFRRSIGPVRKVSHDRVGPAGKQLSPRPRAPGEQHDPDLTDTFSDQVETPEVAPDEALFYTRPGLQLRQQQRLRRGQLAIGDELDLHGMTASQARTAIMEFITACRDRQIRCVRIIHGKGYGAGGNAPVLKNRLNSWLRQHREVLAFSSAIPRDGGTGALYVLLRSQREE